MGGAWSSLSGIHVDDGRNADKSMRKNSTTKVWNPEHDEILLSATVDFDPGCGKRAKRAREMRRLFRCVSTDGPGMCGIWNVYLGLVGF